MYSNVLTVLMLFMVVIFSAIATECIYSLSLGSVSLSGGVHHS